MPYYVSDGRLQLEQATRFVIDVRGDATGCTYCLEYSYPGSLIRKTSACFGNTSRGKHPTLQNMYATQEICALFSDHLSLNAFFVQKLCYILNRLFITKPRVCET